MQAENDYTNFPRYLAAKKSVDDRALNHHVWQTLHQCLQQNSSNQAVPLRVIEVGGGIGTMIERILDRSLLTNAQYVLVDAIAENIAVARQRLPTWAAAAGFQINFDSHTNKLLLTRSATHQHPAVQLTVELVTADCFTFAANPAVQGTADLLIAHALLDLFEIDRALPQLIRLLKPGGLLYATINFDGNTILQPEIDRAVDDRIEAAYHATMDARITDGLPSGDSRSGRHLFGHLRRNRMTILDVGSSDWVVFAGPDGYPADEAYFLHFIVETIHGALQGVSQLDQSMFAEWIKKRHAQIERDELVYIAHQLDFLAQLS